MSFPTERERLDDSKAQILVIQDHLQERAAFGGTVILLNTLSCLDDERNPESSAGPEHFAYVIYTSGSTGKPKGTLIDIGMWGACYSTARIVSIFTPPTHGPCSIQL
ncbi:AMP-binding protein [Paenibacillus sp. FSL L8-0158]|uniref:AMP-binding protein n=1 Tax=Paenibacillus sp. FSL L8-0158 TaxID=2954752 RepID=UPI0031595AC1